MKFYLVGTAEPITEFTFLYACKEREFTEEDLFKNISKVCDIPLFDSQEDAINYARTFRIQRPSKLLNPQNSQFAPVIEIECDDPIALEEINKSTPMTFFAHYAVYLDRITNFGEVKTLTEKVTCKMVPNSKQILSTIQIKSVLFPDSGREQQQFLPAQHCTLF